MAFLIQGQSILTDDRDLSAVGIATISEDINSGRLLYDSNGNVGAGGSVLVTKDGNLQWVAPSVIGISTGSALTAGSSYFVTENGSDSNDGESVNNAWATVAFALSQITVSGDDALYISAGDYTETFPLTVPAGLTIKGAGQRATTIRPSAATETENGFLLNNDTTIEDLTIGAMFKPQGSTNYAFSYAPGAAITTRGPYISRVSVVNRGSNVTAADPYGYNSADNYPVSAPGAAGFLADGSVLDASTTSPSMLLNEITAFPVANIGIDMVNGTRMEILNSFVYFANEGIKGRTDLGVGLSNAGRTRLSLENPSSAPVVAETIQYFDTDGVTVLAAGTIDEVSGNYVYLDGSGTGTFEIPTNNTPIAVNFVGSAQLSNAQVKFGTASLDATATQSDAVTAESGGFGFGTGDLTVEGWFYFGALNNGRVLVDMRSTSPTDSAISLRENGSDLEVFVGSTSVFTTTGSAITTGAWIHLAVTRSGTTLRGFINGSELATVTNSDDLGTSAPLHLGANYQDTNGVNAFIDDFRIEKGVAKYVTNFTPPTAPLTADKDTSILLHFDGTSGATETVDDIIVTQDIRFGSGKTATKTTLADYSQFGCDLRSIGCAVEYGNQGVVGDGQGTSLRLFAINFNYVGSGGDYSNDPNLAIQGNEVIETNDASVYYVSIDQGGDFRVGDAFFVDQATGRVTFSETATDLTSLSSLTITDGTNASVITPTSGKFGNLQLSGNTLESTTGDVNIVTAGAGDLNVQADLNVVGIISASGVNLDSITNGDTSIALDDTGVDGTIRFITDGTEAGRFDNDNDLTVTNDIAAQNVGAASTVSAAFFEGDGSKLSNISAGNVDLTGTDQELRFLTVTGLSTSTGIALTVTGNAQFDYGVLVQGTLAANGTLSANGDIIGNTVTNISGINSVTATEYYGDGSNLTGVLSTDGGGDAELTGTLTVEAVNVTGAGQALDVTNSASIGSSVTAANFFGDGSGLTNISSGSVDLTGTDQELRFLTVTGVSTDPLSIGMTVQSNAVFDRGLAVQDDIVSNAGFLGNGTGTISGITSTYSDSVFTSVVEAPGLESLDIRAENANRRVNIQGAFAFSATAVLSSTSRPFRMIGGGEQTTRPNILLGNGDGVTIDGGSGSTLGVNLLGGGSNGTVRVTQGDFVVTEDIRANGNIIGDAATNISGINSVTAVDYYGNGSNLTGVLSTDGDGGASLDGHLQVVSIEATGAGIALTVTNDVAIGGSMSVAETIYAQGYDSLSDAKLKENIVPLTGALHNLGSISGVSYTWKSSGEASMGVIAQEVQAVYPELVTEGGESLSVNYNGLIGVLIESVKELNAKVEDLQRQLDEK